MEKAKSNGTSPHYVESLEELPQRRTESVNISDDPAEPRYVLMRAMSGGEKRRFHARTNKPDPDNHLERIVDLDWWNGERTRALIALSAFRGDGRTPLFPQARDRALRILAVPDSEDWALRVTDSEPDPNGIDELDPAVIELLLNAADRLSLISTDAWKDFVKSPLAQTNPGFIGGALASAYRTPSTNGTA